MVGDRTWAKYARAPLDPSFLKLDDKALEFFHATISPDDEEVRRRIFEVQKETYEHFPFSCIRLFHHVKLQMAEHPIYSEVVAAGKEGNTKAIDIGCCMGTDVRKLAFDGYPAKNITGTELSSSFIRAGHKLFGDGDTSEITFISADIFELPVTITEETTIPEKVKGLVKLRGELTHVYSAAFFHMFDEAAQYQVALRIVTLVKPEKGAIIFGSHHGAEEGEKIEHASKTDRFAHSPITWGQMWKKAFAEIHSAEFAERVHSDAFLLRDVRRDNDGGIIPRSTLVWNVKIL